MKKSGQPTIIGIIGGGQLGRMLIEFGIRKVSGYERSRVLVLASSGDCSVARLQDAHTEVMIGDLQSANDVVEFGHRCDVITWEVEHINIRGLLELENSGFRIVPRPSALQIIQDKGAQKHFYDQYNIPTAPYTINPLDAAIQHAFDLFVIKARTAGFDGRGVWISCVEEKHEIWSQVQDHPNDFLLEKHMGRDLLEVAVILAMDDRLENMVHYTPVSMQFHHDSNSLDKCTQFSWYDEEKGALIKERCIEIAQKVVRNLKSPGVFAVELFVLRDGSIYVNETAPRVHNSGHHTIHTSDISQFEMLARVLTQTPIVKPIETTQQFIMRNLYPDASMSGQQVKMVCRAGVLPKGIGIVDYDKGIAREWRKMGHITHVGDDVFYQANAFQSNKLIEFVPVDTYHPPVVGVVMGSTSDWQVMEECCKVLREFNIDYETMVVSAHRTPDRLAEYARQAKTRGLRVIIAGAGGAAHLPGMLAAYTAIPVVGVPIKSSSSALNGVDSLQSIVQMPPGVPVGCMAINGSKNAGIYAAQILGLYNEVEIYKRNMEQSVICNCYPLEKNL